MLRARLGGVLSGADSVDSADSVTNESGGLPLLPVSTTSRHARGVGARQWALLSLAALLVLLGFWGGELLVEPLVAREDGSADSPSSAISHALPDGGDAGGRVVATGTPETVARNKKSATAPYLSRILTP